MKDIDLPPYAPLLMEATRAIGYNLESAIADILDNSISAKAKNIEIRFSPYDDPYVAILDDGEGMDKEKLKNAMRYGSYDPIKQRDEEDLGRFGLGMKTASLSQCRRLTVLSKQNKNISAYRWDLDYINQTRRWSLLELEEVEFEKIPLYEELKNYISGTIVLWQNTDKICPDSNGSSDIFIEKMEDVRNHLSLVFHRYISGEKGINKIKLSLNNNLIEAIDPFLSEKSQQLYAEEEIKIGKHKVTVTPYLMPHITNLTKEEIDRLGGKDGLRKNQGFYIYRNKRLLVWGNWFKLAKKSDLSKLARIKIDIPNTLDSEWTLDIKKSTAVPPHTVKKNLKAITQKICESSKRTWNFRGKIETSKDIVHIWQRKIHREGLSYEINQEHPLIKQAINNSINMDEIKKILDLISQYLPINQLYSDLTSDEKINDIDEDAENEKIEMMIQTAISNLDSEAKNVFLENIKNVEPFNKYKSIINKYKK